MEKFSNKDHAGTRYNILRTANEGFHIAENANGKQFHLLEGNKPAYKERYDQVAEYSEGYAAVRNYAADMGGTSSETEAFHITHEGQPAYADRYFDVSRFAEGRARVSKNGETYYFIDQKGIKVGEHTFVDACDFSNGTATVTLADGRHAQIDKNGTLIN